MTTDDVRARLVDALRLDLVGPEPEDAAYQDETLETAPSQQYLGGFLVPQRAPSAQRGDDQADEQLDVLVAPGAGDDEDVPVFCPSRIRTGPELW